MSYRVEFSDFDTRDETGNPYIVIATGLPTLTDAKEFGEKYAIEHYGARPCDIFSMGGDVGPECIQVINDLMYFEIAFIKEP